MHLIYFKLFEIYIPWKLYLINGYQAMIRTGLEDEIKKKEKNKIWL